MLNQKFPTMKKLILLVVICLPSILNAQRLSRAYVGLMLHDNEIGGSLMNSFGINQYLGIGAGVDITSYESELMVPFYLDVRVKYPINNLAPFAFGQFGKQLFTKDLKYVDETGSAKDTKINGKLFYGAGAGISFKPGNIGFFVSYTQRWYQFNYKDSPTINGRPLLADPDKSLSIITAGLVF